MKIGIHKEYGSGCIGGAEYMMAVLADGLSEAHQVEIVHHQDGLTRDRLANVFGISLDRVGMRYVAPKARPREFSANPWKKYANARERYAELSRGFDVFVCLTHGEEPPPFCHAGTGVLVVLFPLSERPSRWPYEQVRGWGGRLKERIGRRYREWEWQKRLGSYRIHVGISEYVRRWTRELWGIDCGLLHPPVDVEFSSTTKQQTILCVGRFSPLKNQRVLVESFQGMDPLVRNGWTLVCAGGVGSASEERAYFDSVRALTNGHPVDVMSNLSRTELKSKYEQAAIFWHAAGFGADEALNPGITEHFGIVTVEAMAAGCVPVVIRKGGQPELVTHGVSGFLWDTPEELQRYTMQLANDDALRARMAAAARQRSQGFNAKTFMTRFNSLLAPHVLEGSTVRVNANK